MNQTAMRRKFGILFPSTFRAKMLVYFGLIFAAGLFAAGISGVYGIPFTDYRGEYGLARAEAIRELNLLADAKKAELMRLVAERQGDAATFCESPLLRKLVVRVCTLVHRKKGQSGNLSRLRPVLLQEEDYRALAEHMATVRKTYAGLYDKIMLADAVAGTIIVSTDERDLGRNVSRDPAFIKARSGIHDEVTDVVRERSDQPSLVICHAIKGESLRENDEDTVAAVLIMQLRPELFAKALEVNERELGRTGDIFLVNEDAVLLTPMKRPLPDGTTPRPLAFRVAVKPALLAAEGSEGLIAASDYGGVPVLAAFRHLRPSPEVGWGIVVKKDQAEVFAPIHRLLFIFALKGALLSLLVLGLTYVIASRLAKPIKELSRTAERVEKGDFSARALAEGPDEVGVLARAFNSMVMRFQNWHRELEEQVQARTAQLVTLNEELAREVTERKRAGEALRTSEGRFRELLENVRQGAIILDREGHVFFCNDFLLDLTGWTREEVLGRSWFDLFIPEGERSRVKAVFAELLETAAGLLHYENPILTKSGARRTIVWDNTLLRGADGSVIGTASLGQDVTEQRSLEEQLRHSQKMEAVGQLAGGVAHDFNNLLTVIIGNCELIKLKAGEDNPVSDYVEQILFVSGKAARLTQSLLAFSRKQFLNVAAVDVNDCVKGVSALLARIIGEDIEFRLALTDARLPVMADCGQLEQVLVNLATNARDAMPGGGELLIETRRADLDAMSATLHGLEKAGAYAVIQVSDTGSGMDQETRAKIFEPFFTTKEVGRGTGLGLAMVFGTVRQHGGYIDVSSEPGRGTTFKIYLPLRLIEREDEKKAQPEPAAPGGSETLLVVEDNEDVRETTVAILEEFGYRVIAASDGEEAIVQFMENRDAVSLAILDVVMPKMNGKEVSEALKKVRPDLRVLFTSGYAADVINRKVLREEGLYLLQKPVSATELLQKVRELLDRA